MVRFWNFADRRSDAACKEMAVMLKNRQAGNTGPIMADL